MPTLNPDDALTGDQGTSALDNPSDNLRGGNQPNRRDSTAGGGTCPGPPNRSSQMSHIGG